MTARRWSRGWVRAVAAVGLGALLAGAWAGGWLDGVRADGAAGSGRPAGGDASGEPIPVAVTPLEERVFEERVAVAGVVEAERFALVSARTPGPLDAIFVDEGDQVAAGQTRLFQTDSLKLSKAAAIAEQNLTVAECAVRESRANLEQVTLEWEQAQADLLRYEQLVQHDAFPLQQFEQQETRVKQAAAMKKHAEALVALAEAKRDQARAALEMAQKDLADSLVVAPISGRVAQRLKEPGEMAGAGTPVLRIEDLSLQKVSIYLAEQYYGRVVPGRTKMRVRVGDVSLGELPVAYKSPTVDKRLRTFEVQAVLEAPPPSVVPGRLAEVEVLLASRPGVGCPSEALQQRGGRWVVFVASGERARMAAVRPGLETDGWTELLDADLPPGTPVAVMGQHLLEDGSPITVVSADAPGRDERRGEEPRR